MSPKKSKRSSPIKSVNGSVSEIPKGQGLKLRLKVSNEDISKKTNETSETNENENSTAFVEEANVTAASEIENKAILAIEPISSERKVPKIKLNFSRSTSDTSAPSLSNEFLKDPTDLVFDIGTGTSLIKKKQRGRPKKDKSAVLAAALAASQPNEMESEEKRKRRRAAEAKIKSIDSMDSSIGEMKSISINEINDTQNMNLNVNFDGIIDKIQNNLNINNEQGLGKRRRGRKPKIPVGDVREDSGEHGNDQQITLEDSRSQSQSQSHFQSQSQSHDQEKKRRRRRKHRDGSNEFIDITDGANLQIHHLNQFKNSQDNNGNVKGNGNIVNQTPLTVFNPYENEFVQRSKTFLNIAMQHDTYTLSLAVADSTSEPFKSLEDAVDRILPFHLGINAGQYTKEELEFSKSNSIISGNDDKSKLHWDTFSRIQDRYRGLVHSLASKKVTTELLLLEQRLCLEEEKFLLVKLKNEYAARFLKSSSTGSRLSNSSLSSSGSIININIGTDISNSGSTMSNNNLTSASNLNSFPSSSRPSTPSILSRSDSDSIVNS